MCGYHEWSDLNGLRDSDVEEKLKEAVKEAPYAIVKFMETLLEYYRYQRYVEIERRGDERIIDAADTLIRKLETLIKRYNKEK